MLTRKWPFGGSLRFSILILVIRCKRGVFKDKFIVTSPIGLNEVQSNHCYFSEGNQKISVKTASSPQQGIRSDECETTMRIHIQKCHLKSEIRLSKWPQHPRAPTMSAKRSFLNLRTDFYNLLCSALTTKFHLQELVDSLWPTVSSYVPLTFPFRITFRKTCWMACLLRL